MDMKKVSLLLTTLVIFVTIAGCKGGKGGDTPTPPSPPNKTDPQETQWNKDRTLEFVVVSNHSSKALFGTKKDYSDLSKWLSNKSSYSMAVLMNADASADGAAIAMALPVATKLFQCYNFTGYRAGVPTGNLVLNKEYFRDYTNQPVGNSYLLSFNADLKATTVKQLNYNLNVGVITINDQETLTALGNQLSDYISGTKDLLLLGTISKGLTSAFPKVAGYEFKEVSPAGSGNQVTFLFAKKSFMHRETTKLFDQSGALGYSVKVEAGVKR